MSFARFFVPLHHKRKGYGHACPRARHELQSDRSRAILALPVLSAVAVFGNKMLLAGFRSKTTAFRNFQKYKGMSPTKFLETSKIQ